jgi:hypothetical protein
MMRLSYEIDRIAVTAQPFVFCALPGSVSAAARLYFDTAQYLSVPIANLDIDDADPKRCELAHVTSNVTARRCKVRRNLVFGSNAEQMVFMNCCPHIVRSNHTNKTGSTGRRRARSAQALNC